MCSVRKIGYWNCDQLHVCCEGDKGVEMSMGYVSWNVTVVSTCEERRPGLLY